MVDFNILSPEGGKTLIPHDSTFRRKASTINIKYKLENMDL